MIYAINIFFKYFHNILANKFLAHFNVYSINRSLLYTITFTTIQLTNYIKKAVFPN